MNIDARLDLIGIVVADMATSLAFYRRLGLDIPTEADAEPHVELTLPGGIRLAWDTEEVIRSFHPSWNGGSGRVGLAFLLPEPSAVDKAYTELTAAGALGDVVPFDAPWGQRYAGVLDPDGTGVDLFAPLSG